MRSLYLNNNQLTGEIPPELGNLSTWEGCSSTTNQLTGEIPPELGQLVNIRAEARGRGRYRLGNLVNIGALNNGNR